MQKENITFVVDNLLCTGCGACNVACSKRAISMTTDSLGAKIPSVNADLCNSCGLCAKVCPGIDMDNSLLSEPADDPIVGNVINVVTGKSTDEHIYRNSQSGGAVTSILSYLFDSKKIDAAIVVKQKDLLPVYGVVTNSCQLHETQKSQYITVDVLSGLREIDKSERVAIVGMPCHIEGLLKLVQQRNVAAKKVVYKLGLICGGTFPGVMADIIESRGKSTVKKEQIVWRSKSCGNYKEALLQIGYENGTLEFLPREIRHLCKPLLTPPRCNICFDKLNIHADLVFGDPWGMRDIDKKNGNSVIFSRTEIGDQLLKEAISGGYLNIIQAEFEEVYSGQKIDKKKSSISNTIFAYENLSLQLPAWYKTFHTDNPKDASQMIAYINRYRNFQKMGRKRVVKHINNRIDRILFVNKIKKIIRKILH